jgi:hypothetical protein
LLQTASSIGTSLGQFAKRVDAWKKQRTELATELEGLIRAARAALQELGHGRAKARRGGRPRGYKASEETRAKLRAAWKERREAAAAKPVHKREAPEPARAKIAAAARARTRVRKG